MGNEFATKFKECKQDIDKGEIDMSIVTKEKNNFLDGIVKTFSEKVTRDQFRESFKFENDDYNLSVALNKIPGLDGDDEIVYYDASRQLGEFDDE